MELSVYSKTVGRAVVAVALMAILASASKPSFAAEGPKMGGHIESSFNWSLLKMEKGAKVNELRSYDKAADTFLLNTAHVMLAGNGTDKLNYAIELDAGSDANTNKDGGLATTGYVDIQEAYIKYMLSDKLGWTSGKFVTFMGIEVIEGPANPTVSRGYLFGLAEPYTHTGTYLEYAASEMFNFKFGFANGWDVMVDTANRKKSVIGRVGITLGDTLWFGVAPSIFDTTDFAVDLTGALTMIEKMPINFQFNYGALDPATWMGAGIQPVYNMSDTMSLGLRLEFFSDPDGARSGITTTDATGAAVPVTDLTEINVTVTPAWKPVEGFMVRPELRFDLASEDIFANGSKAPSGNSLTASVAVSYMF